MKHLEKYLVLLSACLLLSLFAWYSWGDTAAPVIAAFWGIVFVTPALMDFIPWLFQRQKKLALQPLNGTHYEFGATRIRVLYAANLIWVASEDLHQALGAPLTEIDRQRLLRGNRHFLIPGTTLLGISEKHLRDYVLTLRSPEGNRFITWFEKDVVKPIKTKVEQGMPVAETVRRNPV